MQLKDKIVKRLLETAKRHRNFKIPILILITCIMWVFHVAGAFRRNKRRCFMLTATAVLFLFCSSFTPHAEAMVKSTSVETPVFKASAETTGTQEAESEDLQLSDFLDAGEQPADTEDIETFIKETESQETDTADEETEEQTESVSTDQITTDETEVLQENSVPGPVQDWKLILVNKQNPVPDDYEMELVSINGSMQVDKRIAKELAKMLEAAKNDDVSLMICSAYRSYERQTTLFENKIRKSMKSGMSYLDAYAEASYSVTVPGTSEHQLGLALDIVTPSYTTLDKGYENTDAGKWLKAHSSAYGFILRYPEGKEHITGITYEPWHFRYVGKQAAEIITENGLTLEEYLKQNGNN